MTQRVTFLVAFDLPSTVDREVARKALQETIVEAFALHDEQTRDSVIGRNVSVVHHPTVRRD